jgi:CTP:molybdopterin cytidylyltransferase MocA
MLATPEMSASCRNVTARFTSSNIASRTAKDMLKLSCSQTIMTLGIRRMQETAEMLSTARMSAVTVMPAVTGMLASTERDTLNSMPVATRMPV